MRIFCLLLFVIFGAVVIVTQLRTPQNDRAWQPHLARAPLFSTIRGESWAIDQLRAYEFDAAEAYTEEWQPTTLNPDDLSEVWFFLEPFEDWDGVAHTFLSFVFDGPRPQTISVSIEARKEIGETYSGFRGLFNAYELIYLWSTEKDILTRIAINLDHELYAYRLDITPDQGRRILEHFINRTNRLKDQPRFYNSFTSNCTNELAKSVNEAFPKSLPWRMQYILTGTADRYLFERDFIDPLNLRTSSEDGANIFKSLKAKADIQSLAKTHANLPASSFSLRWREDYQQGIVEPSNAADRGNVETTAISGENS